MHRGTHHQVSNGGGGGGPSWRPQATRPVEKKGEFTLGVQVTSQQAMRKRECLFHWNYISLGSEMDQELSQNDQSTCRTFSLQRGPPPNQFLHSSGQTHRPLWSITSLFRSQDSKTHGQSWLRHHETQEYQAPVVLRLHMHVQFSLSWV